MNKIEFPRDVFGSIDDYFPVEKITDSDPRADVPPVESVDEFGLADDCQSLRPNGNGRVDWSRQAPLQWLNLSEWDKQPVPRRKWAIENRVPLNQAGLFSGEGGTGKSIIELTKDIAHVLGKDWLGSLPEPGPAFYLGDEDDADELHIRIAYIAKHYGVTFKELADGGLHVMCLLGQDATLAAATRGGRVETTVLYKQIYEAAGDIKPKNISIDTLSRAFAGSEIDRVQESAGDGRGRLCDGPHASKPAGHDIGQRHFRQHCLARRIPIPPIPQGRLAGSWRAARQRSARA
jgi:AAA domain